MGSPIVRKEGRVRADDLRDGDRYELRDGVLIVAAPSGGDHARQTLLGSLVIGTDPMAVDAGVDAGYALNAYTMRAPDIAVGGVGLGPGWSKGVPPLAVEYAGVGQDERSLRTKIEDLLGAGTRAVWVVRLVGPPRVEVHEPEVPMVVMFPGDVLEAPGVLQRPVSVGALFDRAEARRVALLNLLSEQGYGSLDDVAASGMAEGRRQQASESLVELLRRRFGDPDAGMLARVGEADTDTLARWTRAAWDAASAEAALAD